MLKWITLLCLVSSSAFAGKLVFDGRLDGQGQTFDDAAATAGLGRSNFRFLLKTARLDYQANLNDKTNVRARMILNTDQGTVNKRDSVNNLVDLFFINHKVADNLELTLGKFSSDMNGWEHQVTSADVYLFSQAYSGGSSDLNVYTRSLFNTQTSTSIASFTWANTGTMRYYTGAKLTYKFDDQELAVHTADLNSDETAGTTGTTTTPSQTTTMTGVVYKGSFGEKFIQPIVSYHEGFLPGFTKDAKAQYTAAGLRFNFDDNVVDLDYIQNMFKSRTVTSTGLSKDDSVTSILLGWGKTFGQWTPRLKLESSTLNAAGEKMFDVTAYGAVVEYRPVLEENFRYHLAYNFREYKPTSGNKFQQQEVIVGTRIAADILK